MNLVRLDKTKDADPNHFSADPDTTFHFTADQDPHQGMRIFDLWATDPPRLHFQPPRLHGSSMRLYSSRILI